MKRALALAAAVFLLSLASPLHAAKVSITGRAVDPGGKGVSGAKVLLIPVPPTVETVKLALAGKTDPEPAVTAATDSSGTFQIAAPDAGMWKVRVEARGFVPLEASLSPLLEDTELPEARLLADAGLKVTVADPAGKPAPGARVRIADERRLRGGLEGWSIPVRLALAGADGTATLPRAAEESLTVRVGTAGFPMIEKKNVRAATASFRLAAGKPRRLQVRDEKGKGVPGVTVWVEDWLAGRTSETGALDLVLPGTAGADLRLAAEDGRRLRYRLKVLKPGTQEPDMATLPAAVTLAGRIVSTVDGRPLTGALAWVSEEPGTLVRTGSDGAFRLSVPAEPASSIAGAAAGFFEGQAEAGGNRRSPSLGLKPKLAATGVVVDEAGRGLPGAAVNASLVPGRRSNMMDFSLYRSGGFARSGAGGRFRLPNLAPGAAYDLRVSLPGFASARAEIPAREQGQPAPELKIVLRVGRQAVGMVLDGSRAGVAGAQVRLRPAGSSDPIARMRAAMNPDATDRIEGTTDAKGRYTVSHLVPGTYDVTVQARGFAPLTVPGLAIPEGQGTTDLGTVVLSPGVTLEGRVVDPAGQPIEGAEVRAEAGAARGMTLRLLSRDPGAPDAFTAADGSFRLEDRSPGESLDLSVSHPSYGPGNAPGVKVPTQEPVRIVLQPMTRVSGRTVSKDGKGIAGAEVTLTEMTPMSFGGMSRMRPGNWKRTVTDADGAFSFAAVSPGGIEIRAQAPRYQAAELQGIEAKAGQELAGLELLLPPAASVEGRVLSPDGRPVPGAEVTVVQSDSATGFGFSGLYAQTDGDGRYNLEGVPPGARTLEAKADGYRRAVRDLEVTAGAANTADLTLERGFEVSGRVIDEAGNPVASVQLMMVAGRDFFSGVLSDMSGADGSFRFAGVQEGTFRITARKAGYAANPQGDSVTVAGASVSGVEVKLTAGGTISGRLSGLEFSQLSRVRVTANGFRPGQVDPEGAYSIPNMPPGEWDVEASVPDTSLHAEGHVTLEPGMVEAKLDLQFGKGFTLTGVVLRNNAPLAGAGLRLERTGTISTYQAASDHQGAFRFGGLDAGKYELTVNTPTGARHKETLEISGDREVQIDLKSASLAGRVIDAADSSPVAGAEVTLESVDDKESRFNGVTSNTDSRGAFRVAEVADGVWKLRASHDGYAPAEKEVQIAGADADGVELSLSPTEGLTIEVVLPTGQAPERIRAGVLDPAGRTVVAGYYPVGENGRVRLSNVPPGSWQIFVDSDYAAPALVAATVPGPAVRVVLLPAGQVRVTVPALAKENTAATVSFLGSGGVAYRAFDFNEQIASQWDLFQGHRSFPRIPVGTWQVTAKAADGRTFTGTAAVVPGGSVEVVLK